MVFTELDGGPRFNENDCLSPEQIKAFFSKLKSKKKEQLSQSQSSDRSTPSSSTTSAASSQNYSSMDINTTPVENQMIIDNGDFDGQQILNEEEMNDFESIMEATQIHHLRNMAMKTLSSSLKQ